MSVSSYATGVFVGADALYVDSVSRSKNSSTTSGSSDHDKVKDNRAAYGFNAGVRLDVLNLLASAELFYDKLNTQSNRFNSPNNNGDRVEFNDRYGAKLNLGIAIIPRATTFVTVGMAKLKYNVANVSGNSYGKSEYTPLYGLGLLIDLPAGISLKIAADYQQLNINANQPGAKIQTYLGTARVGLVYNF